MRPGYQKCLGRCGQPLRYEAFPISERTPRVKRRKVCRDCYNTQKREQAATEREDKAEDERVHEMDDTARLEVALSSVLEEFGLMPSDSQWIEVCELLHGCERVVVVVGSS